MAGPFDYCRIVSRLLVMTTAHPAGQVRDAELAARLGYSTANIRRYFLSAFGEPVCSFERRMRLERAAGRLVLESTSVSDVAREASYCSGESFSKAFSAHFGCSPSEFRGLNRSQDCLLPGYLLSLGQPCGHLPSSVRLRIGIGTSITFVYDRPVLLARVLPSGRIDWRPR